MTPNSTGNQSGTDSDRGGSSSMRSTAEGAVNKVRETTHQVASQAREGAESVYERGKDSTLNELENLASALRTAAESMQQGEGGRASSLMRSAAEKLEGLSSTIDRKNFDEVIGDVERLARRNPAIFIGGAVALGFIASRFLKASRPSGYGLSESSDLYGMNPYSTPSTYPSTVSSDRPMSSTGLGYEEGL